MALPLPLDKVPQEKRDLVQKILNVEAKQSFMASQHGASSKWVQAFRCDTANNILYVPFFFAKTLNIEPVKLEVKRDPLPKITFNGKWIKNENKDQEEAFTTALKHLKENNTVTLNLSTAFGKTIISVGLTSALFEESDSVVVALVNKPLKNNWPKEFAAFTNAGVHVMEAGRALPKKRPHVYVAMASQLSHIPAQDRTDCILIIDEAHKYCTPDNFPELLHVRPKRVIALTATTNRDDDAYQAMWAVSGMSTLVKRIAKIDLWVMHYQTGFIPVYKTNKDGSMNWTSYVDSIHSCETRTQRLFNIILGPLAQKKILIGVYYKRWADYLHSHLKSLSQSVSKFYGNTDTYQDARIVVAVIPKMKEGVDEKSAAINFSGKRIDTVIPWVSMKNELLVEQFFGRGFRDEHPYIIYPVENHNTSRRHWTACKKWFKSRNAKFLEHKEPDIPKSITCYNPITGETVKT